MAKKELSVSNPVKNNNEVNNIQINNVGNKIEYTRVKSTVKRSKKNKHVGIEIFEQKSDKVEYDCNIILIKSYSKHSKMIIFKLLYSLTIIRMNIIITFFIKERMTA